jgi:TolB-like protein
MKKAAFFLMVALFAGMSTAGVKYVAVVETEIDEHSGAKAELTSADVRQVTDELRRSAVKSLPRSAYIIMTTETVIAQGSAVLAECAEENCIITLGSKIGADFIVRGTISKLGTRFTLKVEIYETEDGTLVASSEPVRSETIEKLVEGAATVCADMYRAFVNAESQPASVPTPAMPKPEPLAAAKPEPAAPPEPEYADAVNVPVTTGSDARQEDAGADTAGGGRHLCSMYSGAVNPAFVNEETRKSVRYLYAGTLKSFHTHEVGFAMPLGRSQAVGAAWIMNSVPSFGATDQDGAPTGMNAYQEHFVALTYARGVYDGLTVGGNINLIAQNIYDIIGDGMVVNSAIRFGFGMDFGLACKILRHPVYGNHVLGFSTHNIVNAITGTDEKYPAGTRFSLLSDFWERRVFYGADFAFNDILAGADEYMPGAKPSAQWAFTNTLGTSILRVVNLCVLVGFNNESLDHYGFAAGLNAPRFLNLRDVEAMFQYVSIINPGGDDASRTTFSVRMEIGKHR